VIIESGEPYRRNIMSCKNQAMIIRLIVASRSIEIDDPKNFRTFSVRIEGAPEAATLAELLGRIAVKHDREHAWISEAALRDWPSLKGEAWWQDGLTGMIAAVQKFGWIDNDSRSIRAHIEHAL
jgi:predicted transcriptional regulator